MRVLLVEDEPRAAQVLTKGLREHSFAVDISRNGRDALYQAAITDYDAVILDVMLPGVNGVEVCRRLRRDGFNVPILMLTARDTIDDRTSGLDSGADDYVVKPFNFGELLARLRAIIRRGRVPLQPSVLAVGGLRVDLRGRQAFRQDRIIKLTSREFALLEFLIRHSGEVVGRARSPSTSGIHRSSRCRTSSMSWSSASGEKSTLPGQPSLIATRRGDGYMMAAAVDPSRDA